MKFGALGKKFDAYTQRQFVTEFININSLADHHIWSATKTLPATLLELSSMERGPRTVGADNVWQSGWRLSRGAGNM